MQNFNERLIVERERLGLKKGGMARAGGVANSTYTKYEDGSRLPDAAFLADIADAGADVQYILTGVRSKNAAESNAKCPAVGHLELSLEEQLLLERYRNSPQALKDAALRVLLGGEAATEAKINVEGNMGHSIGGSVNGGNFSVDMRKERNKKG